MKIEKGIPIPAMKNYTRWADNPLSMMGVGDSFLVPNKGSQEVSGQYIAIAKRHGIKLSVRKVDGGTRVWRIA